MGSRYTPGILCWSTCVAYSGHIDILGVLLLLLSAAALQRRWRAVAAVAFGLAVAVKFLPIVLTPLYWRRVRVRDGVAGGSHRRAAVRSVSASRVGSRWDRSVCSCSGFALMIQSSRRSCESSVRKIVAGLAVLVGLATSVWLRRRHDEYSPDTFAWPMAASLLCAPVVYPWYLLWLLPFVRSVSTVPLIDLDHQHHPDFLRLASAHAWRSVVRS